MKRDACLRGLRMDGRAEGREPMGPLFGAEVPGHPKGRAIMNWRLGVGALLAFVLLGRAEGHEFSTLAPRFLAEAKAISDADGGGALGEVAAWPLVDHGPR